MKKITNPLTIQDLINNEGWEIKRINDEPRIIVYDKDFPITHPCAVHLKLYRTETNSEIKYQHMKAAHDYLWPNAIWHYWTEDRFRAHCEDWWYITYAAGASASKSYDSAKIAYLYWIANPKRRAVIVASTSLESIEARIWGYICKLAAASAIPQPIIQLETKPPKILYNYKKDSAKTGALVKDKIHGIFAVAAKEGSDDRTIKSWIGRHPDDGLLVILDEATDMPSAIIKAFGNLETAQGGFQCIAIGNSNSIHDLHGAMSTPKAGWNTVDPLRDTRWETTQRKGLCLFFSCYNSPAIHEADPKKKEQLSRFLITEDEIEAKELQIGKDSDEFYRFVLGFWRFNTSETTMVTKEFLNTFDIFAKTEWSGLNPLRILAALDPAFSTGGDKCILRLALLGQDTSGNIVLDYRDKEFLFQVPIKATSKVSADIQICDYTLKILEKWHVRLADLCIDANGQGRVLPSLIQERAKSLERPLSIYSTSIGSKVKNSFDVIIRTTYDLWFDLREFIQTKQIRSIDHETAQELIARKTVVDERTRKVRLETKKEYKTRMMAVNPKLAHSPDKADAAALVVPVAVINYGFVLNQHKQIMKPNDPFDVQYQQFLLKQQQSDSSIKDVLNPTKRLEAAFAGKGLVDNSLEALVRFRSGI